KSGQRVTAAATLAAWRYSPRSAAPHLAGNFRLRSRCELLDQQQQLLFRPSPRVRGVSPYKPHHGRVQREGLRPAEILVCGHSRHIKELCHPSDSAAASYGRHGIAVVDFNLVWAHLLHSGAYAVSAAVIL